MSTSPEVFLIQILSRVVVHKNQKEIFGNVLLLHLITSIVQKSLISILYMASMVPPPFSPYKNQVL